SPESDSPLGKPGSGRVGELAVAMLGSGFHRIAMHVRCRCFVRRALEQRANTRASGFAVPQWHKTHADDRAAHKVACGNAFARTHRGRFHFDVPDYAFTLCITDQRIAFVVKRYKKNLQMTRDRIEIHDDAGQYIGSGAIVHCKRSSEERRVGTVSK